jgi:VanZ family protein
MIVRRALAIIWAVVVFGLHSIPRYQLLQVPGGDMLVRGTGPDKIAHTVLFLILGFLWSRCFPRRALAVVAGGIAYGYALELYQGWLVAGRACSSADALADTFGMVLGVALAKGFRIKR